MENVWPEFPSVVERYFETYSENGMYIQVHKNRLVVVTVPVETLSLEYSVKFVDGNGCETTNQVTVSGKRKRGGKTLQTGERIAIISSEHKKDIEIVSPMPCKLIELNLDLLTRPESLRQEQGWVAILMPDPKHLYKYTDAKKLGQ